ncbi:unnamed protein product, partial [Effrenium voratum]
DEAELVVATLRAGLSEKGKAWLQQEVAAKAQPQLRALARQLDVRQRVAGGKVTKADLAAAVVEQLCGQEPSSSSTPAVTVARLREVVAAKGDQGPVALRALLRPLKLRDASPSLTGLATDLGVAVTGLTRHAVIQRLVLTLCPLTSPLRSAEVKRKFWRCLERHRGSEQETLEARIEATLGEDQCAEFRHGLLAVFLGITVEAVAGRHLSARDELQLLDAKLSEAAACVSDMEQSTAVYPAIVDSRCDTLA